MLNGDFTANDPLHDWYQGNDHWVDESVLLKDLDDLIASYPGAAEFEAPAAFNNLDAGTNEPTAFDLNDSMLDSQQTQAGQTFAPAPSVAPATSGQDYSGDVAMDDVNFDDMMFDFDSLAEDQKLHN